MIPLLNSSKRTHWLNANSRHDGITRPTVAILTQSQDPPPCSQPTKQHTTLSFIKRLDLQRLKQNFKNDYANKCLWFLQKNWKNHCFGFVKYNYFNQKQFSRGRPLTHRRQHKVQALAPLTQTPPSRYFDPQSRLKSTAKILRPTSEDSRQPQGYAVATHPRVRRGARLRPCSPSLQNNKICIVWQKTQVYWNTPWVDAVLD